jgi:hypothetical protein
MWQILDDLYLGDELDAQKKDWLKDYAITHILNCAAEVSCYYPKSFQYLHLELYDPDSAFIDYISDICHFIDEGRKSGSVLVHCRKGLNRSPSAILAYLRHLGFNLDQAMKLLEDGVNEGKLFIAPSDFFLDQIQEYFDLKDSL